MKRMDLATGVAFLGLIVWLAAIEPNPHAQVLKGSTQPIRIDQQLLSGSATPGSVITPNFPPHAQDDSIIAVLKQQSGIAQSLTAGGSVPGIQPERTMALTPAQIGQAPPPSATLHCPAPSIAGVDRKPAGIDFTPTEPYNRYVIEGCFSGDIPKSVYLLASQSFFPKATGKISLTMQQPLRLGTPTCGLAAQNRMDLAIDFPGPDPTHRPTRADPHQQIDVHVPPCISGVLDQWANSVTLVVEYANGQKAQRGGFNFFAARETEYLQDVPRSKVTTVPAELTLAGDSGTIFNFASPVPKYSAAVVRHSQNFHFAVGSDQFNLNGLQLGFAVMKPEVFPFPLTPERCRAELKTASAIVKTEGSWSIQWGNDPSVFLITRQESSCQPTNTLMMPAGSPSFFDETYAIKIPVKGPRGVAPWADGTH